MTVGFALWLVYRLRVLREARSRAWAGAMCLAIVAMSFGAAIGKLNMIFSTVAFDSFIDAAISDQSFKRAGLVGMLTFTAIGFVVGLTFIRQAARGPFSTAESAAHVRDQLTRLSERVIHNWDEQLVSRVDALLERNECQKAVALFQAESKVSHEDAENAISDWPEYRLCLQVDLLCETLNTDVPRLDSKSAAVSSQVIGAADAPA